MLGTLDPSFGCMIALALGAALPWLLSARRRLRVIVSLVICLGVAAAVVIAGGVQRSSPRLEIYPEHTRLRVGEKIHYSVFRRDDGALNWVDGYSLEPKDPDVVRVVDTRWLEAVSPGRTEVLVLSNVGERVLSIDIDPETAPPMPAVHHSEVDRIVGEELLFVGHANLDGFDHTAVAKPGIDRLVRQFKARGHPVVYFVSREYPYWYTEDREPDLAIVSEGQEHQIAVDAKRIVLSGGGFMFCVLRNVQMTLHGMLQAANRDNIEFVFPSDAIWAVDMFTQGQHRLYPAPMALLDRLMSERSSEQDRYEQLVVPFLERLFGEFPVVGYPALAPNPPLEELLDGWTIDVAFDGVFLRSYRPGDPTKVIRFDFLSNSAR